MFKILIHEGDTKDDRLSYFDTNSPAFLEQKSAAGGGGREGGHTQNHHVQHCAESSKLLSIF